MQAQATERDLEAFQLKYSDAAETADLIKSLFKATPTAKHQGPERMRTFVDPITNTLVVQASTIDMMILRRLLSEGSDLEATEAATAVRTYIVGPLKHANAAEMVKVLKKVYHEPVNGDIAVSSPVAFGFTPGAIQGPFKFPLTSPPVRFIAWQMRRRPTA